MMIETCGPSEMSRQACDNRPRCRPFLYDSEPSGTFLSPCLPVLFSKPSGDTKSWNPTSEDNGDHSPLFYAANCFLWRRRLPLLLLLTPC